MEFSDLPELLCHQVFRSRVILELSLPLYYASCGTARTSSNGCCTEPIIGRVRRVLVARLCVVCTPSTLSFRPDQVGYDAHDVLLAANGGLELPFVHTRELVARFLVLWQYAGGERQPLQTSPDLPRTPHSRTCTVPCPDTWRL